MKILFVCTGNTCRSPMAEGIFRHEMEKRGFENIMCQSAGLSALDGQHPSENAVLACKEIGVDISGHIARRFTPEEIDVWDVYFTMSKTHAYILMQAGVPAEKIYVPHYIDDPYGGDLIPTASAATRSARNCRRLSSISVFKERLCRLFR